MKRWLPILTLSALAVTVTRVSAAAAMPPAPVLDRGEVEATVTEVFADHGKLKINKIMTYDHHAQAKYDALKVGDEVAIYFQWGSAPRTVDTSPIGPSDHDIQLPGVKVGDKIAGQIAGCPADQGCGNGWTLYEYALGSARGATPRPTTPPVVLGQNKNAAEITTQLLQQKQVSGITSMTMNKQKYQVAGYRAVKLLGIFPIKMPVQLVVNAQTGQVESTVSPQWAVLVR
jgi:hypothetical protein